MKHLYKYVIIVVALLLRSVASFAEGELPSGLCFTNDTYDYGHIAEEGGAVRCYFEAVNNSTYNIEIENIVTTCGCTTASYEHSTVAPGKGFSFEVSFDPMNRPGRIDKHIYVHVSDSTEPIRLRIAGYVQPRERTIDELYPFAMGNGLRLVSNFHAFGYVESGKSVEERIGYVNTSDHEITLSLHRIEGSDLLEIVAPRRIAPQATGDITLRYNNTKEVVYGSLRDRIEVRINGIKGNYDISTYAIAVDNFDSTDDISAPRLAISKNIIKFGEVNSRNVVIERSVELQNEGASPLLVRSIECESPAVEAIWSNAKSIAPNSTARITLKLHSRYIKDWDNPFVVRVLVITNDPLRPMQAIRVNALPYGF